MTNSMIREKIFSERTPSIAEDNQARPINPKNKESINKEDIKKQTFKSANHFVEQLPIDKGARDDVTKRINNIVNARTDNIELVVIQMMIMIMFVALETFKKNCLDLEKRDEEQIARFEFILKSAEKKATAGNTEAGFKIAGSVLGGLLSAFSGRHELFGAFGNQLGSFASGIGTLASVGDIKEATVFNGYTQNSSDSAHSCETMFDNNKKIANEVMTALLQFLREISPLIARLQHGCAFFGN